MKRKQKSYQESRRIVKLKIMFGGLQTSNTDEPKLFAKTGSETTPSIKFLGFFLIFIVLLRSRNIHYSPLKNLFNPFSSKVNPRSAKFLISGFKISGKKENPDSKRSFL